jgi:hypothetical protein
LHTPQAALNTGNRRALAYIAHGVTEGRSPITTQTATPTDSHSVVVHQHSGRPTPPRTAKRPTLGLLESDINAGRVHDAGPNVRRHQRKVVQRSTWEAGCDTQASMASSRPFVRGPYDCTQEAAPPRLRTATQDGRASAATSRLRKMTTQRVALTRSTHGCQL